MESLTSDEFIKICAKVVIEIISENPEKILLVEEYEDFVAKIAEKIFN